MSCVRNASEFRQKIREARYNYQHIYGPRIAQLRLQCTGEFFKGNYLDILLEAHTRHYFVDQFLTALNWKMDQISKGILPEVIPEAPVLSKEKGTIRFLDYFGIERDEKSVTPLIIVETKRSSSTLPISTKASKSSKISNFNSDPEYSSIIAQGLNGVEVIGEWQDWLATLKDYVKSIDDKFSQPPERVVQTNGNWIVVFLDPKNAFLTSGAADPAKIIVYKDLDDIEIRHTQLFMSLEYSLISKSAKCLNVSRLVFQINSKEITKIMYGLLLLYREQKNFFSVRPQIVLMPILILNAGPGRWIKVIAQKPTEFEVPHDYNLLGDHLSKVTEDANKLLNLLNSRLQLNLEPSPIEEHYIDQSELDVFPGVSELSHLYDDTSLKFLLVTGEYPHYILENPCGCNHNNWELSRQSGDEYPTNAVYDRSTNPRSFFVTGEMHHCANKEVADSKAEMITTENRDRCGVRSGEVGMPFCEIFSFEELLCCKACVYSNVCFNSSLFLIPCCR